MEFTLLDVSTGLVFWSAVTFLLLLVLLKKFLWGPLIENLDRRETMINDAVKKAEETQKKSEDALKEYNKKLAEAREDVRQIVAKGKESAEKAKADILDEANKKAASFVEKAKKEIEAERFDAINQIKQVVVDISISVAEKMLKRNLNPDDHVRLIEETMQSMDKKD